MTELLPNRPVTVRTYDLRKQGAGVLHSIQAGPLKVEATSQEGVIRKLREEVLTCSDSA